MLALPRCHRSQRRAACWQQGRSCLPYSRPALPPSTLPCDPGAADAPFCKHIFVPNWTGAPVSALPITQDNEHLLRSGARHGPAGGDSACSPLPAGCSAHRPPYPSYIPVHMRRSTARCLRAGYTRRRPEELAVLTRWFPAGSVQPHEAKCLDIILYRWAGLLGCNGLVETGASLQPVPAAERRRLWGGAARQRGCALPLRWCHTHSGQPTAAAAFAAAVSSL